jgi:hypothetical protein
MNHRFAALIALAAGLVVAGGIQAQIDIAPPAPTGSGGGVPIAPPAQGTPSASPSRPAASAPATLPSASSILQNMLNSTTQPGTAGSGDSAAVAAPQGPLPGADGLLREGQQIDLRSGRLKKDEAGNMIFIFDPKETPAYPPMGVIPSRRLAAMEDAAGFGEGRTPNDMAFRITAEVTQYRGKNYVYIKPLGPPIPATNPAPAAVPTPLVNPVAPNVPVAATLPQGSIVTNRVGRLVRDPKTGAKLIAFDSDNRAMADPPMGVVPCKYLAVLEDATDDGNKPLPFRLSGEVLTYRGKNYLYLKMVTRITDVKQGIGAGTNLGG